MGEEKSQKGADSGDQKKDAAAAGLEAQPIVLRLDLHCAGCAQKVKKVIKHLPGVESVVPDAAANRVVITGPADAAMLKARIEAKTKKPVEIVSAGSAPKEEAAVGKKEKDAGGKKADKDAKPKDKEPEKKQPPEEKKPKELTVFLKIPLHCDGCADRIRRRIYKIKGVKDVGLDGAAQDLVKVTGTMDVAAMLVYLKDKLNRAVEVAAPGKKSAAAGNNKDDKKDGAAKDEKKEKGGDGDKNKDAGGDGKTGKDKHMAGPSTSAAAAAFVAPPVADVSMYQPVPLSSYVAYPYGPASYYYGNVEGAGSANPNATYYASAHHYPPSYPYRMDMVHAPQLFSDENPNACSVM